MSTLTWLGGAPAVAQVVTVQVTAYDAATTYAITINGKKVSVSGTTDVNTTASALQVALAASTIAEFAEVTWTVASAIITGTAATAGIPFTATSSVSGGTGTIGSVTTTTASAGPNDWSTAANWSTGAVPVSSDTVYLQNSSVAIQYGLAQSAVTLTALYIDASFVADIGLPRTNASGSYAEYRATYLAISATSLYVGTGAGIGSGRIKLDLGSNASTIFVYATGSPAEDGLPALILKGTHASNVLNAQSGTIGVALFAGETSTLLTVRVGFISSRQTDVTLTLGAGCTLTTIKQYGGTVYASSAVTTWDDFGGVGWFYGTGALGTFNIQENGTLNYMSSGAFTTGTVGVGCVLDYDHDPRTKTGTTLTVYGTFRDNNKVLTWTTLSLPNGIGQGGATVELGTGITLARS